MPSHIYTLEKLLFYILYLHSEESVCIPECNRSESSRDEKEVPVKEDALTGKKAGNCVSLIVPQQDCQLQDLLKQLRTPAASQRVQLFDGCVLLSPATVSWPVVLSYFVSYKQSCHCIVGNFPGSRDVAGREVGAVLLSVSVSTRPVLDVTVMKCRWEKTDEAI